MTAIKNMRPEHNRVTCVSHGFQNNYERGFVNGLADNGVDVTLIGSDRTDIAGVRNTVEVLNLRGSQSEDRPAWKKAINLVRYHLRLLMHVTVRRPQILHVIGLQHPIFIAGVFEGLWFRLFSKRFVLTVHNLLPHDRETRLNRVLHQLAYRFPHELIVHTPLMKVQLNEGYGIPLGRIHVMEHGIEPWTESSASSEPRIPTDKTQRILFFGKVAPYKGLDILLESLKLIDYPFSLTIAGTCNSLALEKDLRKLMDCTRHQGRTVWENRYVDEAEIPFLFKSHDVLALPYRHIDQSGVLFQAFRYGLPILATRVGAFSEYVKDEVGELSEPEDVNALHEALVRLYKRRESLSREAISNLGKKYFWNTTTKALGKAYGMNI